MARGFSSAPGSSPDVLAAQSETISRAEILAFSSSSNKLVREVVATRADCPLGALVGLAHDHVVAVRVAVASNPTASETIVEYLSADRSVDVVTALLTNPNLPADLIIKLAQHRKSVVRAVAIARLNSPAHGASVIEDEHNPELRDRAFETHAEVQTARPELAQPRTRGPLSAQVNVEQAEVSGFVPVSRWSYGRPE